MKIIYNQNPKIKPPEKSEELYEILKELPKPDARFRLSASQKKWWYWFGAEFISTHQFSQLDLVHLQKAAFWMDARCKAIQVVNQEGYEDGLVQTFRSGATNISAHVTVIEKADKHLGEVSSHFGLSFKDRKKLNMKTDTGQLDLFEQFLQKTGG